MVGIEKNNLNFLKFEYWNIEPKYFYRTLLYYMSNISFADINAFRDQVSKYYIGMSMHMLHY